MSEGREARVRSQELGVGSREFLEGELVEVLPNVFACALMQQCHAVRRTIDSVVKIAVPQLRSGFAYG